MTVGEFTTIESYNKDDATAIRFACYPHSTEKDAVVAHLNKLLNKEKGYKHIKATQNDVEQNTTAVVFKTLH